MPGHEHDRQLVAAEARVARVRRRESGGGLGQAVRLPPPAGLGPARPVVVAARVGEEAPELAVRHLERPDVEGGNPDGVRLAGVLPVSHEEVAPGDEDEARHALVEERGRFRSRPPHGDRPRAVLVRPLARPVESDREEKAPLPERGLDEVSPFGQPGLPGREGKRQSLVERVPRAEEREGRPGGVDDAQLRLAAGGVSGADHPAELPSGERDSTRRQEERPRREDDRGDGQGLAHARSAGATAAAGGRRRSRGSCRSCSPRSA